MTGRDVMVAALLGAEEFGFATAPLVTMGCVMMRVCNLDTCPAGIATQNPELRKRFAGKPEYVENFMRFIAEELREYMAKLGVRTVDELVGRSDFLKVRGDLSEREAKLDLSNILNNPFAGTKQKVIFDPKQVYDFELDKTKDITEFLKQLKPALDKKQKRMIDTEVTNVNRSLGTIFGSEITKKYDDTLDEDTFIIKCSGAGGQNVNKVETGVRLRYQYVDPDTGEEEEILIENTESRKQLENRNNAMRLLKSQLYDRAMKKRLEAQAKIEAGKKKIEWGSQIRSYVFDDRRVKDHRTNYQTTDVDGVMDGKIDGFIKAYLMEFPVNEEA